MQQIQIDPEFQSLVPALTEAEYHQLKAGILADGCRDALVVWNGILLDGHNRKQICDDNKLEYQIWEIELPDRDAVFEWIVKNQFGRRNMSAFQRSRLALKLEPIIEVKAKANQKAAGGAVPLKSAKAVDTREELAKIAGVSPDTISKTKTIIKKGTPEQQDRADKGGAGNTVNAIYNEIRHLKVKTDDIEQATPSVEMSVPHEVINKSIDNETDHTDSLLLEYSKAISEWKEDDDPKKKLDEFIMQNKKIPEGISPIEYILTLSHEIERYLANNEHKINKLSLKHHRLLYENLIEKCNLILKDIDSYN